jgi:peroxiredoxin
MPLFPIRHFFAGLLAAASLAAAAQPATTPPAKAAPATLTGRSTQGGPLDLQQLRGKVVLLFFWSTDCPVCLDKLPELRRNLEGWRGKDFVIVAVSQDRSAADLKAYEQVLDRVAPPNPQMKIVWRRDAAHRDGFGELPLNVPTTVVIDRQGQVVKQLRGRMPAELWDDIAELVLN